LVGVGLRACVVNSRFVKQDITYIIVAITQAIDYYMYIKKEVWSCS